ncbi:IclR family transcriptional regulator [Maribius pontilimi]|uniref:IclR family transcriptional regulator n=1 Tax=Palleronia pontilimi TaxID=1964209 RepID=A0A934IB52_9RHOB|nr:IclR family transcriptional regulator [Palleronia pontilimi]MBJ3762396.1 IclR family transcriptional regulator [Palleronia pontilimi]
MNATGDGTVGKALDVLDRVAAADGPVRFSELMQDSAYPKATLYRLLQTLTSQGMLSHDEDTGSYALGVRLVRLAHKAWSNASLAPVAHDTLDWLSRETGEAVHLAQLDAGQVLYVDKVNRQLRVDMFSATGRVGPAYCTGIGKAMLAFLPEAELAVALSQQSFHRHTATTLTDAASLRAELETIRETGLAFDREEHEPGIVCIATPILTRGGRMLGAVSITSTPARRGADGIAALAPLLREARDTIETDIHAWRFPEGQPNLRSVE